MQHFLQRSGHNGVDGFQREEDVPRDVSIGVALRRGSIVMRLLVYKTGNSMGLILEARSSFSFTKSVAYGKAVFRSVGLRLMLSFV